MPNVWTLSSAILRSVGLNPDEVYSVEFTHVAGDMPRLKVGVYVYNADSTELEAVERMYELKPIEVPA